MSESYKTVVRKFQPNESYAENGSNTLYTTVKINLNVIKAQHKNIHIVNGSQKYIMLQE